MTATAYANVVNMSAPDFRIPENSMLKELLKVKQESFQECLFRHIDEKGLKDSEVYNKACMDRKLFSKIRGNRDYHPRKQNALALALALELTLEETNDLLAKAGWALTMSNRADIIVAYCISKREYDIVNQVNPILYEHNLPTLGDASPGVFLLPRKNVAIIATFWLNPNDIIKPWKAQTTNIKF